MRFKLDENLPLAAARILAESGHDAHTVLQEDLGGAPDSEISTICKKEDRVLVTLDTDFCNILNYPPSQHPGIIVIRTMDQSKASILAFMRQLLQALDSEELTKKLWIVEKGGIRIR